MIIDRDMCKNTHLICPIPKGKKYDAAVRWEIPVVTAEWLKVCAAQSTRVDETPFLIVKSSGIQILNKFILYMYIQKFV